LVEAEDFNLHYELSEPAAQPDIKMSAQKASSVSGRPPGFAGVAVAV